MVRRSFDKETRRQRPITQLRKKTTVKKTRYEEKAGTYNKFVSALFKTQLMGQQSCLIRQRLGAKGRKVEAVIDIFDLGTTIWVGTC
jgi:hypothetical protein